MAPLEEQLAACTKELAQLQHELESFTYSVAHDLRAPLRGIAGYLDAMREDHAADLPAPARAYLESALECATRMQGMVEDLLQISRLGRRELVLVPTPLGKIIADVRREIETEVPFREIEWRIAELPSVVCDPALARQVFAALLGNAVKFTRHSPQALIEVFAEQEAGATVLVVRDNGAGFDPQRAGNLFAPFFRLHPPQQYEGAGVGLAKAARIVRRHGGRIWADAAENRGATFYFTLEG